MKNRTSARGKWFTFLLYPDCNAHRDILNYLLDEKVQDAQKFAVAGIMHDRDVYHEGPKQGMPKKPHMHIIMHTDNKHTAPAIAKMMGGQRTVFRLYQRDLKAEHSTELTVGDNAINRQFSHETGDEYPVLVDKGYGELQPIDLDVPPEVWELMETANGRRWDSLPEFFYNRPQYPQFTCASNQYWKLVTTQDLSHAEVIADPLAYYLYLQHKDIASVRNGKAQYPETAFFGNEELLAKLRGKRGLRYQVSQVIEYFNSCGVTNGKDALECLLYGDCTEELFNFYWKHTSKFSSYFRALELESNLLDVPEDNSHNDNVPELEESSESSESSEPINFTHKHHRELKEHIHECDTKTAKRLSAEYEAISANIHHPGETLEELDRNRLRIREIEDWFAIHKDQKLFTVVSPEEQLFNEQLRNSVMSSYETSEQEQAQPAQSVQPQQDSPSPSTSSAPSQLADMDADLAQRLGITQII